MTNSGPPIFIAFASSKGGVGKSTSCVSLGGALAHHSYPVHIIDFDQTETLYRWYTTNPAAREIPGLTVEKGPSDPTLIGDFLKHTMGTRRGFVLADLAGSLTKHMLMLAAFSPLTITPAKLSEPDLLEARKLHDELAKIAHEHGRPIRHRILINEASFVVSNVQKTLLGHLNDSDLERFETMMYSRAPYAELYLTGLPPHFNPDQARPSTQKAIEELEYLLQEIFNVLQQQQAKAAA